jgi:DNA-binding CsgD family transcriptional regulator
MGIPLSRLILEHEDGYVKLAALLTCVSELSPREAEVVALYCLGGTRAGAAKKLNIQVGSAKVYLYRAYRKLMVNNRQSLLSWVKRAVDEHE